MLYDVRDLPKKWYEWILYPIQMLLAVFVATILISQICGTPIAAGLLGGALGTLVYQIITKFKSPIFISNSGATVSAVIGALALGATPNYFAVFIGGLVVLLIYGIFALVVKLCGIKVINKIFPAIVVGPVTMVIGLNLAGFIPTYVAPSAITLAASPDYALMATTLIAVATMIVIAIKSASVIEFSPFWFQVCFLYGSCFDLVHFLIYKITFQAA
jgi:uracil permease